MKISLNPLYRCNFRCNFCYLSEEQLRSRKLLDLNVLDMLLREVPNIELVELYGGEISLLSPEYFYNIKEIIRKYYYGDISIITNLYTVPNFFLDSDIVLNVSYDFDCRQHSVNVLNNILSLERQVNIITLVTPCLLNIDRRKINDIFNIIANLQNVEFKPYSHNKNNNLSDEFYYNNYEDFVKYFINSTKSYNLINLNNIERTLRGDTNSFSNDHIYITPNGKYAVLEFDDDDNEYFKEIDTYHEYIIWTEYEKLKIKSNQYCNSCKYYGICLTEHYRNSEGQNNQCSGFKGLIEYVERKTDTI